MNFYRSVVSSGSGNVKDYVATVNGEVVGNTTCASFFAGNENVNYVNDIYIGNEITSCDNMFNGLWFVTSDSSNLPNIHIGQNVVDCSHMFHHARAYNVNRYVKPLRLNITFPKNAKYLNYLFYDSGSICGDIYINNGAPVVSNMLAYKNNDWRLNIWCHNSEAIKNGSIGQTGNIPLWPMTNGYYSAERNIYLYNNYTGT